MRKRLKNAALELQKPSLFSCTFYTETLVTAIFYKGKKHYTMLMHVRRTMQRVSHFDDYLGSRTVALGPPLSTDNIHLNKHNNRF